MSSNLISIAEDEDVAAADALMRLHYIRHLPVIDAHNELSGIITVTDIARCHDHQEKVRAVMTPRVRIVKKSANIKTIIEQMLKFKISSMLVAQNDDVVGIVTTDDLLQLLYELLDNDDELRNMDASGFLDENWDDDGYEYPLKQNQIN